MKIREITTNLYEAPTIGQSLDSAVVAGANRLRNSVGAPQVPSKYMRYLSKLKNSTYCVIFVKPIVDYFMNMNHWEELYKDNPAELAQRTQLERGYLITELTTIAGTLTMGEVGIFLLSELFGFIPIIGPLLGRIFKTLGPAVQAAAMLWLSSDEGRTAIAKLVSVKFLEDLPGYAMDVVDLFKKGFEWAKEHAEKEIKDITGQPAEPKPADPNAVDPNAPPAADSPWAIKPDAPPPSKKEKLDPSQMKQIVAPTDDSAYRTWDRVTRDANGKLQLK